VVVDTFTRFTWLAAVKSTTTKEVTKHLKNIFHTFGKPINIITDKDTAFTSKKFADFVNEYSVEHRLVAVATPWANGTVERVNRFLKSSMTKMMVSPSEWKKEIGTLQYIINNTYHSTVQSTPAKLMFGTDQRCHDDSLFARFTESLKEVDANFEISRSQARDRASTASEVVRNYNKLYTDKHFKKLSSYKEGDYVMVRNTRSVPGEGTKIRPHYKGPYMVHKELGNNRYVVRDIPGFNVTSRPLNTILSSDRLKKWIRDPSAT